MHMQIYFGMKNFHNMSSLKKTGLNSSIAKSEFFCGKHFNNLSKTFTLPNNKLKSYSIADYKKLNSFDKKLLRFEYKCSTMFFNKKFYKNMETIHDVVTDFMKASFDKKYGEGKYVVLPIGRSLSSLCKVLGYKIGEENVINIPLSNASRFSAKNSVDKLIGKDLDGFKHYLESVGLTKEKINKSGKRYILMDFCFSGQSLKSANNLFKSDKLFGENSNISTEDIYNLIPDSNNVYNLKKITMQYLYESKFKPYSFVKKNIDLAKTKEAINTPKTVSKTTRLMWFRLLDNFMQGKNKA